MELRIGSLLLTLFAINIFAYSIPPLSGFLPAIRTSFIQKPLRETLDDWIEREERIALDKLLANVKPGGRNVEGNGKHVADGTVIASPSTESPNYYYQWVRDAAITTNTLVDLYADDPSSKLSSSLSTVLDAYATLQTKIQRTSNPSGSFDDLQGLGEPKFQVDGTPFTGSWGRPQRDGPALRAITLINYLRAYNASHPSIWESGEADDIFDTLYEASMPARSVIKADLEYVSHFWNASGFDLWEEVDGLHFFTAAVQLKALREGTQIARAFGDDGAAHWYNEQATYLERFVRRFWNKKKGHLVETLWSHRTGLDCGLLLGSLHSYPSETVDYDPVFPPYSDETLISLLALVQDQRERFPINLQPYDDAPFEGESIFGGVGLGRYPEDVYDGYGTSERGGNPWFLCTSSAAEVLYRTASRLTETSSLTITPLGLPFYSALLSSSSLAPEEGATYGPSDAIFHSIVEKLKLVGDEFLEVVKTHVDGEGSMSEQFDQVTGYMRGATDLTWSYGAFLQAVGARKYLDEAW
ncbi:glycoside hydrolase family 15 protein [Lentithecium fluviatile CBS 122367]|uniref:glucan 1,4-alpha-glucosidase n=1 Tax=Lentithecium fluviatile CBS 122367 TaxID=1168545 RepID=A0A6G1IVZ7_9PLEO|nr:glycoside hydrolase family 15 protein [Lentithecium fluviatile CBS 122367]